MKAKIGSSGEARRRDPMLIGIACVLLGSAAVLIAYVAKIVRDQSLDARPRHARGMEPIPLNAADEPFWFYGIVAALAVLAIVLLAIARKMLREARQR
jgi:hypothetical protein